MARRHVVGRSALMFRLCLVMAVGRLGGVARRAGGASVGAFGLTNWFLSAATAHVDRGRAQNVVALTVFVLVTVVVSFSSTERLVDRARRLLQVGAGALALSAARWSCSRPPPDLLEQLRPHSARIRIGGSS